MIKILDARFVTTAVDEKSYPEAGPPEIAFVGRSNVGKSSMINTLAQRRKLVRVSNTPGRTRAINFFDVDVDRDEERTTLRLVDLPGYGFAKVSKAERASWKKIIEKYLTGRRELKVVVSIIDAEVGPTDEDQEMLAWLSEKAPRVLLAATKIDRLPKAKRKPRLVDLANTLELPLELVLPFSSVEKIGFEEAWDSLVDVASAD